MDMLRRAFTTLRTRDHSGNLYLAGMVGSAAGAGGLYWASERDRQRRADLMREFEGRLAAARVQAQEETEARKAALEGKQTLWTGKLLAVDHRLQGHLMLRGCRVGQVIDILEEGVGQDGRYLTCIDRNTGAVGMHLSEWVERQ
jgi:hypothetical protein